LSILHLVNVPNLLYGVINHLIFFVCLGASYTLTAENGYFSPGSHFLLSPRLSLQQSPQNAFLIALTILFIALDKDTLPIHKTCFLLIKAFILKLFVLVKNKITISFIDIIQAASY